MHTETHGPARGARCPAPASDPPKRSGPRQRPKHDAGLVEAAQDAIGKSMSSDSREFLERNRQEGGE